MKLSEGLNFQATKHMQDKYKSILELWQRSKIEFHLLTKQNTKIAWINKLLERNFFQWVKGLESRQRHFSCVSVHDIQVNSQRCTGIKLWKELDYCYTTALETGFWTFWTFLAFVHFDCCSKTSSRRVVAFFCLMLSFCVLRVLKCKVAKILAKMENFSCLK